MRLRFMCTILCAVCNQFWALLRALAHCGGPKAFKIRELEWAIADVSDCSRDEVVALHTSDTIAPAMTPTQRSVLREGIVAGLLGAAVVAVWFLFFDLARGRPLLTPGLLGAAVFQGVTDPIGLEIAPGNVLGYTLLHGLAFVAFGVIAASVMAGRSARSATRCGARSCGGRSSSATCSRRSRCSGTSSASTGRCRPRWSARGAASSARASSRA